jgi:hypothetical protein
MSGTPQNSPVVLCWPKRLLSADDLRVHLTSQREVLVLPRTVITPLAADELKAKGIRIRWQVPAALDKAAPKQGAWCYAQARHHDGIWVMGSKSRGNDPRRLSGRHRVLPRPGVRVLRCEQDRRHARGGRGEHRPGCSCPEKPRGKSVRHRDAGTYFLRGSADA